MNLENFPLFQRLISTPGLSERSHPFSPVKLARLNDALAAWQAGMEQGTIENACFVNNKDFIVHAVETAWRSIPRDPTALMALPQPHQTALASVSPPNLHTLLGRRKRVENTPDSPLRTELLALLDEITPLAKAYGFLKANVDPASIPRRQFKTEEEREAERFELPLSSSQAVAQAREMLERTIDGAFQNFLDGHIRSNRLLIEGYLKAQEQALADPSLAGKSYSPKTHLSALDRLRQRTFMDAHAQNFLSSVLRSSIQDHPYRFLIYFADESTWQASDSKSEEQAKFVRDQFLHKTLSKLIPILEAKGDDFFDSIQEVGNFDLSRMEGEFDVRFRDGSSFRMRNSVIFSTNDDRNPINRITTTFHNVVMPDSNPMPNPSQERMCSVFGSAFTTPPLPKPIKSRRGGP